MRGSSEVHGDSYVVLAWFVCGSFAVCVWFVCGSRGSLTVRG